jgi:hypothetical protein
MKMKNIKYYFEYPNLKRLNALNKVKQVIMRIHKKYPSLLTQNRGKQQSHIWQDNMTDAAQRKIFKAIKEEIEALQSYITSSSSDYLTIKQNERLTEAISTLTDVISL